jgi:hypothetical protein
MSTVNIYTIRIKGTDLFKYNTNRPGLSQMFGTFEQAIANGVYYRTQRQAKATATEIMNSLTAKGNWSPNNSYYHVQENGEWQGYTFFQETTVNPRYKIVLRPMELEVVPLNVSVA